MGEERDMGVEDDDIAGKETVLASTILRATRRM